MTILIGLAFLACWAASAHAASGLAPRLGYGSPQERGYWRSYGWTVGPFAVIHALVLLAVGGSEATTSERQSRTSHDEGILLDSANAAASIVATGEFAKLTKLALSLTGAEIGRHIQATDEPGLFSPLEVVRDGRDRLGAILALGDRAVLAWTIGSVRMTNVETVIAYDEIESLDLGARPGGTMSKDRQTLRITTSSDTYDLVFANVFENGRSIVPFLKGILEGSIRPVFEDA